MALRPAKVIYVDALDAEIGIFTDRKALKSWFIERGLTDQAETTEDEVNNGLAFHVEDPKGGPHFVVFLPDDVPILTIAHEALHIAWYLLEFKGVKVDMNNHEALAYLQQYVFQQSALFLGLIQEVE